MWLLCKVKNVIYRSLNELKLNVDRNRFWSKTKFKVL